MVFRRCLPVSPDYLFAICVSLLFLHVLASPRYGKQPEVQNKQKRLARKLFTIPYGCKVLIFNNLPKNLSIINYLIH